MALALGIGSVFNHSEQPNVSFELEAKTESIRYTISRRIEAGEELFIFYGHKLWFEQHGQSSTTSTMVKSSDPDDGWGGLGAIDDSSTEEVNPFSEGNPNDVIPESELPFTRLKLVDDTEEDLPENIRTIQAWAVDVARPQDITTILKWIKSSGLDTPDLAHLKRVRRSPSTGITSVLLSAYPSALSSFPTSDLSPPETSSPIPPPLPPPSSLPLSPPYLTPVPSSPALTPLSTTHKSSIWPTVYAPRRKYEFEEWTRGRAAWAWDAMSLVVKAANEAKLPGEVRRLTST